MKDLAFQVECPYCKQVNNTEDDIETVESPRLTKCTYCEGYFVIFARVFVKANGHKIEGQETGIRLQDPGPLCSKPGHMWSATDGCATCRAEANRA